MTEKKEKKKRKFPGSPGSGREQAAAYLFLSPFLLLFAVFVLWPILYSGYLSFFNWDLITEKEFAGLDNYLFLFRDSYFLTALKNTVILCITSTVPELLLALLIAYFLNQKFIKGREAMKMSVFLPYLTSTVAVALVFGSIFGNQYGVLNFLLEKLGIRGIDWSASQIGTYFAVSVMIIWRWTGYNSILYLSAMQGVPEDLIEAARIDGAGRFRQFVSVIVPSIKKVLLFTVITGTIGGMQIFTEPLLFNGNGGGANRQGLTISVLLYEEAFSRSQFGYACALAWALFLIIVVISILNSVLTGRIKE